MSNEIDSLSTEVADECCRGPRIPAREYPNLSCERWGKKGHKQPFKGRCRCMSTKLRILKPTSFFCHDPWDYLYGGGVCVGLWTGEAIPPCRGLRYQSQKAVGRMERVDAAGGFRGGGGWLLFRPLHQDPLKRSPRRPIRHGSELFPLIGSGGRADVGAAAGGSDESSSSLSHTTGRSHSTSSSHTHNLLNQGPTGSQHTPLARVTLKDRRTLSTAHFCFLTSKMNINAFPFKLCLLLKFIIGVHWPCMNPLQGAIDKLNILSWGHSLTPPWQ